MATGDVQEHDLGVLREVVAALRAPPREITPAPDAVWGTPVRLLSRDPEGCPGVRWAALALLRDLLHGEYVCLQASDLAHRRRFFCQGVNPAGPEYLQVVPMSPTQRAVHPREQDPWFDEAETYYWGKYDTLSFSYPERTGDWSSVLEVPIVYRGPLLEDCVAPERPDGRCLLATAPLGAARTVQVNVYRWERAPFTSREIGCLDLLKPHFVDAFRQSCAITPLLTGAQRRVLHLVREGLTNRQVGRELGISEATVRTHLQHAYETLGVNNRVAAVAAAFGSEPAVPTQRRMAGT